ncbi:MAG: class I SAM-dependent methyltransferase [Gemmatimonadaceae bacterium]
MTTDETQATGPKSLVMHSAARHYDLLAWLVTLGRERALRERLAELAGLAPGESVLDVGCGTGSLAVAARRRVGATGTVRGVDASPEMVEQARAKAAKAGLDVTFEVARAEALPFADASFDVVLSTLMMHHLPRSVRESFAAEIRRVLKPGGRVLAVDFEPPARKRGGLISRLHRHGHVPLREIVDLLGRAGLRVAERGSVGVSDLQFALAAAPRAGDAQDAPPPAHRSLPPLPAPRWILPAVVVAVVAAHALVVRAAWAALVLGTLAAAAVVAGLAAHLGLAGGIHAALRRHRRRE